MELLQTCSLNFSVGCSFFVQALIFGVPAGLLMLCFGVFGGANHCRLRQGTVWSWPGPESLRLKIF